MKSGIWRSILALAAFGGCAVAIAQDNAARSEDGRFEPRGLVGSWTVQVTQVDCGTGAPLGNPFLSMLTFSDGGTAVETTSNPMFFPAVRGPGHGAWSYAHGRTYKAVTVAFITLNGVLAKTQTITQTIEIGDDPNEFTTTSASVAIVPAAGGPTITGCATADGKRIE
jgi:hypothetical protein